MAETQIKEAAISGVERAAILLMSLGESEAAEVLKHMGAKDVQKLGAAMATLSNVSRERATEVVDSFIEELDSQTSLGVGADDYVRRVLVGEERGEVLDVQELEAVRLRKPRERG